MAKGNRKGSKASRREEVAPVVEEMEETMNVAAEEVAEIEAEESVTAAAEEEIENTLDDGEDEVEAEASEGETKTRKPRGKRQIIFNCASNVTLPADVAERNLSAGDEALVLEQVSVTMPAEGVDFDVARGRAEAIEIFTAKYGSAPEMVLGPYYIRKGISSSPRKRETINVTIAKEAAFTAERGKAVHRFKNLDWNVLVNFTEKPDTVFVFYETLVDPKQAPKDKTKFQKPAPKFLPVNALRDLQKNATA